MESLPVYLRNYRYDQCVGRSLEPIRNELRLCWEEDFGSVIRKLQEKMIWI